jgi:hypothetical protein
LLVAGATLEGRHDGKPPNRILEKYKTALRALRFGRLTHSVTVDGSQQRFRVEHYSRRGAAKHN